MVRFTLFCFFLSLIQVMALDSYSQQTRISLNQHDQRLEEVLKTIEDKTEFFFLYNRDLINVNQKVNINASNQTINGILDELLKGTDISYSVVNRQIILSNLEGISELVTQQQKSISGKVTDNTNSPLPGVSVVIKGTTSGVITDMDGKYSILKLPENGVLQFSFVGMKTQEVPVGSKKIINVVLVEETIGLEEVVAVGYGVQKKSDITGSVASVKSERLSAIPSTNIGQALQGLVAGVNITQTGNSASGQSQSIQIRGRNSILASNSPLIVLDGIIFSGGLSEVNQNDIESIEVLKDASSTAIYGSRGANGVILITSKKGNSGKTQIGFDGNVSIVDIANVPKVMDAEEFYQFKMERVGIKSFTKSELSMYEQGKSTDWLKEATRLGNQSQQNVYISGGNDKTRYYVGGTFLNVKGIAINDDFSKFTGRVNLEHTINPWLKFGTNTQFTYFDDSGLSASFSDAYRMNPLTKPYNDDGTLAIFPWPDDTYFKNPLSNTKAIDRDKTTSFFSNNYLKVDIPFVKGLSYRINTGFRSHTNNIGQFFGAQTYEGYLNKGVATQSNKQTQDYSIENIVDYNRNIGKHNIFFTGLYSIQRYSQDFFETYSKGFASEVLTYYQANVASYVIPDASYIQRSNISQMARLNYNYASKYLLTATVRRDGYSGFGASQKFGIFPSVALGWNISKENFLKNIYWLSNLKLRLSYGESGNQAIDPYRTLSQMSIYYYLSGNNKDLTAYYLTGENGNQTAVGYSPSKLAYDNLGWETSRTANFGVDFSLFKDRVQGSIEIYQTNTFDLLLDRTISPVHGVTSITQNIGKTRNRGLDIQISSVNISKPNFSWSTDFNISFNQNEIVDLYGDGKNDIGNGWFIGKPISVNYDYVFDGIWQVGDDFVNSAQPSAKPGDVKVKDSNGDKMITGDDREIIGSPIPKFTGGVQNTFKYKNFSFGFYLQFKEGSKKLNPLLNTDVVMLDTRRNTILLDYWREDNPINTYPANRESANPYLIRFYEDDSFLRVKDIFLSYDLSNLAKQKVGINSFMLYFNVKNALTFTKWSGLDPEFSSDQQLGQPITRTFLIGMKFSL